jgi:hypothetical protein
MCPLEPFAISMPVPAETRAGVFGAGGSDRNLSESNKNRLGGRREAERGCHSIRKDI